MLNTGSLFGFKVLAIESICDKVQVKKHRRKRINKKWIKRYGFINVPRSTFIVDQMNRAIYCHPTITGHIKRLIAKGGCGE